MLKVLKIIPTISHNFHAKVPYVMSKNIDKNKIDLSIAVWYNNNNLSLYEDVGCPLYFINDNIENAVTIIKKVNPDIIHYYRYEGYMGHVKHNHIIACIEAGYADRIIETNLMNELDVSWSGEYIKHHIFLTNRGLKNAKYKRNEDKYYVLYGCLDNRLKLDKFNVSTNGIYMFTSKPEYQGLTTLIDELKILNQNISIISTKNGFDLPIVIQNVAWNKLCLVLQTQPAIYAHCFPETFGMVVAESMALGKSVITFNTEQDYQTEFIEHGKTGILVNDFDEYLYYVNSLLKNDELRNRIGENAYCKAWELFNPEKICNELIEIYEKVVDNDR